MLFRVSNGVLWGVAQHMSGWQTPTKAACKIKICMAGSPPPYSYGGYGYGYGGYGYGGYGYGGHGYGHSPQPYTYSPPPYRGEFSMGLLHEDGVVVSVPC